MFPHLAPVRSVLIERLFGTEMPQSIRIRSQESPGNRLLLLYGENGSGKTTILDLIFHALAPAQNRAHRQKLSTIRFNNLVIELDAGASLRVYRQPGSVQGSIWLSYNNGDVILKASYNPEVPKHTGHGEELAALYARLASDLRLDLHYIPEHRHVATSGLDLETTIKADAVDEDEMDTLALVRRELEHRHRVPSGDRLPIEWTLNRFVQWLRRRALETMQEGTITTHEVVRRAVERVARGGALALANVDHNATLDKISKLVAGFAMFEPFGLASVPELTPFVNALQSTAPDRRGLVLNIIEPYLETIEARLETYNVLHALLSKFARNLQFFFEKKQVSVSVYDGISIRASNGEPLLPSKLSSGERQLLLMLTSAVMAQSERTVFIIDEPEISLNIKWQRHLVQALLDCSPAQFIIASHSIEVLSPFMEYISQIGS